MNAVARLGPPHLITPLFRTALIEALKAEVGDTLSLTAKARTTQALTGSVVVDEIISGTNRAIIGDSTLKEIDRLSRGVLRLPGTSSAARIR